MPVHTRPWAGLLGYALLPSSSVDADQVDPDGPEPVYRQVAAILARRIHAGQLQPDRPVPSETQLRQEFGVARGTARKAIAVLRDLGLVRTVMGKGSYVLPSEAAGGPSDGG